MSVVVINPNSTVAMTEAMVQMAAETVPDLSFDGWTSTDGPPSIQGEADGALAEAPLLALVQKASDQKADGVVIGCFDDTALHQAAAIADCPVIGIGQASYHYAALRHWQFSVVTTLAVSVPVIAGNIETLGLQGQVAKVRASDVPVLALHEDPAVSQARIVEEALRAEREDDIDAIVLGCAGMVHVTAAVAEAVHVPVIDPVVAAATCMRWML